MLDPYLPAGKACPLGHINAAGKKGRIIRMSDSSNAMSSLAAVISHLVKNFDVWKLNFDDQERLRRRAGVTGHHLNREIDNAKFVTGFFPCADRNETAAFYASEEFSEGLRESGVVDEPQIDWVLPVRYDAIWDRQMPAAIITHAVEDYDRWVAAYDSADDFRRSAGVVGHSVNRYVDDPSRVIVYHQAETFKELRDFLTSAELTTLMQKTGVSSPPDITYHLGDYGTNYGDHDY